MNSHSLRFANRLFRSYANTSLRPPLLWGWECCGWVRLAATLAVLAVVGVPAALGQAATTTTLALSSSSVATGTVVTFTATVRNPSLVTKGTVTFCNAAATYCEDSAIIGTAQLTSAGTAIIKRVPGIGVHLYYAVFTATTANAGSKSSASPQPLDVTGLYPTATTLLASGTAGSNYTLTATVVGTGSLTFSPTETVSFLDTSNSNAVLGTATLGAGTLAQTFGPQLPATTEGQVFSSLAIGDFNGDGLLDVAVTNYYSDTISVFLGAGDGTFGAPTTVAEGYTPYWVVVGDFNGDGKLDLAVSNVNSGYVGILLGNGDGTFQPQVSYEVGSRPQGLAVGDFNRDGNLDLAVANSAGASVSILLGKGDGTFQPQVVYPVEQSPTSVAVADFNGDGFPDLAVTNYSSGTLSVLLGTSTGTFPSQATYGTGITPNVVAVGDFTGNGKPDLAVSNIYSSSVGVFLNKADGTGTFADQATYSVIGWAQAIAVGEFNGDGFLDLAVANSYSGTVTVLQGTGTGTFSVAGEVSYETGSDTADVAVGDFNGDGNLDLAAANADSSVSVLLNMVTETATTALSGFTIPDLGNADLAEAYYGGNTYFSSSTSSTTPLPTSTTLQLNAPPNCVSGLPVVLTAQLSPSTNQNLTPTGTVTFYSPAAGTIPAIGLDTLTVIFTPTDSVDYTTATASVVLTVGDFLALNFSGSPIQTVQQGATASYSLTVAPVGLARLPAEVTFTAMGLPPDATITFSPATIPAGSPATEVAVTIHTSSQPAANTGSSTGFRGPAALGILLLPMLGIVGLRKRLGTIPQFRAAVVVGVLSLGAIMGLTGCGAVCTIAPQPTQTSYTVVITAHCGTVQHSANVTVKVEN
jgi:autotransporter-associated beta strand protein